MASASSSPKSPVPAPSATPPVTAQWKCEVKGLDENLKPTDALPAQLSIGAKLLLSCDGPPARLDRTKLVTVLDPKSGPPFYIVQVRELTETKAELVVAPWFVGEIKLNNPVLTDQNVRVGLGQLELTVASVIQPEKNPEGKPFPPVGPLSLAWPLWLWIFASAVVVGVLYVAGLVIRHSLRRKRLLALLEKNAVAMSPLNHFNKELRKLMRANWTAQSSSELYQTLESEFRWYLARELVIPATDGSVGTILGSLKKVDRELHKHVARDLRITLLELRKAKTQSVTASEDAAQLIELARTVADRIAKERNA